MILFGVAAFPVYAYRNQTPSPREAAAFFPWSRRVQLWAAIVALLSGIVWLQFVAATMSGQPSAVFDANILSLVIKTTDFGRVWVPRLALLAVTVALLLP